MKPPPEVALGTAQFGLAYGIAGAGHPVPPGEARRILELAAERGIRRLDTAPSYGDIEARLADLIAGLPFNVVSKIPPPPADLAPAEQSEWVRESIQRSRARLGSALVGILFHDPHALTEPDAGEKARAARSECEKANIALGISGYDPKAAAHKVAEFALSMAQLPGNALDQRLARAQSSFGEIEVTVRSIFLQGLLLMDRDVAAAKLPGASQVLKRWHEWAASHRFSPMQAAIAVARSFPCDYCVVGVESRDQLLAILDAWDIPPIDAPELASDAIAVIDPRRWPQ